MSAYRLMLRLWSATDRRPDETRDRTGGQALVEFAIIIPIFLLLLFTMVDFGRVIYAQQTITQDSREAARTGLVAALDNPVTTATYAKIRAAARRMSPGVNLADNRITGATGACTITVADTVGAGTCFFPDGVVCTNAATPPRVVVKISVTVPLLTPIISSIVGSSYTPTAQSITYLPC